MGTTNINESTTPVDIGDAISENAVIFAQRVFAAGWISALAKHGVSLCEDGYWISWGCGFDLHFFAEEDIWYCVRYPVFEGNTKIDEPLVLFSSSLEDAE
jgi:hypothetical protein